MPRSKTKRAEAQAPAFHLSDIERMLLVLFNTVPAAVRADVGRRLFNAWTQPSPEAEREFNKQRWRAAQVRFQTGDLDVSTLDDLQAGEVLNGGAR